LAISRHRRSNQRSSPKIEPRHDFYLNNGNGKNQALIAAALFM